MKTFINKLSALVISVSFVTSLLFFATDSMAQVLRNGVYQVMARLIELKQRLETQLIGLLHGSL